MASQRRYIDSAAAVHQLKVRAAPFCALGAFLHGVLARRSCSAFLLGIRARHSCTEFTAMCACAGAGGKDAGDACARGRRKHARDCAWLSVHALTRRTARRHADALMCWHAGALTRDSPSSSSPWTPTCPCWWTRASRRARLAVLWWPRRATTRAGARTCRVAARVRACVAEAGAGLAGSRGRAVTRAHARNGASPSLAITAALEWNLRDPTRAIVGAAATAAGGLLRTHLTMEEGSQVGALQVRPRASRATVPPAPTQRGDGRQDWTWSLGVSPYAITSSCAALSLFHVDAAHR